jgi:hypothetical protein
VTAIDHTQRPARIVHQLDDRIPDQPPHRGILYVEDFLALAANLEEAGYPVGDQVQRIQDINAAINQMLADLERDPLADVDLMATDPTDIAERLRQAGLNRTAQLDIVRQRDGAQNRLAAAAAAQVGANSDDIVKAMRKRFDPAVKIVQTAADHGLTQHTDTTVLLNAGTTEAIEAYRNLGPAVAELDRIGNLRTQLTTIARVGPTDYPIAAFLAEANSESDLDGAHDAWTGPDEVVQHDLPNHQGSHFARIRRQRLGGPWLALVAAGYRLHRNTGAEAHAVVHGAHGGDR